MHIWSSQQTHILSEKGSSSVYITELISILLCDIALGDHPLDGVFLEYYYDVCLPQGTLRIMLCNTKHKVVMQY